MSRHDGVSCDSCLKANFRGKRYKCLICYDYDLCATCYEAGATTTRHTTDHPVQCILTRSDFDVFYGGEALTAEQPQSFTCPYCVKMGFTEVSLQEHVTSEHADASVEVVCPICASLPGGDPNHVTDDFAAHLTLEHRAPREFDEPTGVRHVRRIPHPGRGVGGTRTRRATNMHFSSGGSSLTGLSPSGRETMDPIAELLSQLSSVRSRAAAAQSVSSQLQQLEMQLQSTRQQLERLPRRQAEASKTTVTSTPSTTAESQGSGGGSGKSPASNSQYLLSRCIDSVIDDADSEIQQEKGGRSLFVQELLLSTLTEQLHLNEEGLENFDNVSSEKLSSSSSEEVCPSEQQPPVLDGASSMVRGVPPTASSSRSIGQKCVERAASGSGGGTKQKATSVGLQVGRGGTSLASLSSRGGIRQGMVQIQNQGDRHSQAVHNVRSNPVMQNAVDISNSMPLNVAIGGAGFDTDNPQPLPGRPGSGGRERESRLNPPAAKRNMVKHLSAPKASDREPPPH